MSISKKIARHFVLPLSLTFKLDKLLLGKAKKNCCIVNFHGVRKNNNDVFNNRHIPVTEFERIIIYLKRNFNIVSLEEIFEIHRQKRKVSRKTIAITFDDGYENNFDIALPILKKHQTPATYYIISKGLEVDRYLAWPDVIDIMKKYHREDLVVNEFVFKSPTFYCEELKTYLGDYLKTCGVNTEVIAYQILKKNNYHLTELEKSPELLLLISGANLPNFKNESLIEFGSHSHSHLNMEFLPKEVATFELKKSKELIENKIGKKVISFAFPDGSYTPETLELAKDIGYKNLVAVDYRHNENNQDANLLSRYTISNSTTYESNVLRFAKDFDKFGF